MQKNAIVRSLEAQNSKRQNVVIVEPISSLKCGTCNLSCSKRQKTITAINSKNLPLKVNSFVVISTSKAQSVFEGLVSILFPILMAVSGYFLSNPLYSFFSKLIKKDGTVGTVCPEGLKALIVLFLFAVASLCVLLITRSNTLLVSPEITDVIEPEN